MNSVLPILVAFLLLGHSSLFAQIRMEIFRGSEILPFIPELTKISLVANKDEPCVCGIGDDPAYYLTQYTQSIAAILCLAYEGCKIVGFTIGAPQSACLLFFPRFFFSERLNSSQMYYIGEISLLPGYRRGGVGQEMLLLVEKVIRTEQLYSGVLLMSTEDRCSDRTYRHFWEDIGYKRYGQQQGLGQASYQGFVHWVKMLEDRGIPNVMWENQFAIPNRNGKIDYY